MIKMALESKIFVEEMFESLDKMTATGEYDDWRYLHFKQQEEHPLASLDSFLKELKNLSYDRKRAIIHSSTKNGEIYSITKINQFNQKNSKYLTISGVGNEVTSMTIDSGCAIIEFQVNIETYKEKIEEYGYEEDFVEEPTISSEGLELLRRLLKKKDEE